MVCPQLGLNVASNPSIARSQGQCFCEPNLLGSQFLTCPGASAAGERGGSHLRKHSGPTGLSTRAQRENKDEARGRGGDGKAGPRGRPRPEPPIALPETRSSRSPPRPAAPVCGSTNEAFCGKLVPAGRALGDWPGAPSWRLRPVAGTEKEPGTQPPTPPTSPNCVCISALRRLGLQTWDPPTPLPFQFL